MWRSNRPPDSRGGRICTAAAGLNAHVAEFAAAAVVAGELRAVDQHRAAHAVLNGQKAIFRVPGEENHSGKAAAGPVVFQPRGVGDGLQELRKRHVAQRQRRREEDRAALRGDDARERNADAQKLPPVDPILIQKPLELRGEERAVVRVGDVLLVGGRPYSRARGGSGPSG